MNKVVNNDSYANVYRIKQAIEDTSEFVSMQFIKTLYPDLDEINFTTACRLIGTNGRRWINRKIEQGYLHPIRRGDAKNSKIFISRMELHALKKAEEENLKFIRL